ncbi:MAG: hypothetical protein NTY36_15805 [Deltaproteobacteria bacterium]|nr:hypothetical protein [Deltaproteobacteria bacterium]
MQNVEKRYERSGKARPCFLDQKDLVNLAHIIQETFSKPEIERYFRVSTTLGNTRVFSNSMDDFLVQKDLPEKITELSFWIEGWDQRTRFDKNVLLDFSRYSIQLHVEGTDPVWVYDKYNNIMKFLKDKRACYWPIIMLEKYIIFCMTIMLIASLILSYRLRKASSYVSDIALLGVWSLLIFSDTRKIWPYSFLKLKGTKAALDKENIFMVAIIMILILVLLDFILGPFFG